MEKVVVRMSLFQSELPLNRDHTIDLLHKSVDWVLYNGNADLNGKVNAWLR